MTWCGLPEALSQPRCYVAGVDLLKTFVNNKTNAFLRLLVWLSQSVWTTTLRAQLIKN